MMTRKSINILIITIGLLGVAVGMTVTACGGFFCTNVPIDQSAERIIFSVNGDGTITAIVGINYAGAAEDFSWVVPVPSIPEVDVAETQSLDALQLATDVNFIEPDRYCDGLFLWDGRGGGGGGGLFVEEGHVGPYDYAIVGSDIPGELVRWLRDNGYQVTEDMEPIIQRYVQEGMLFLAMKLSQEAEVGDIQPVSMTYRSDKPMIPIRLTAVAAVEDMPIITWIFAETQYAPENWANPVPDFSDFRSGDHRILSVGHFGGRNSFQDEFGVFFSGDQLRYRNIQAAVQEEYYGLAFITEAAMPTSELPTQLSSDPLLERLINEFPYMTRLRAQLSPEQMTVDPTFIPAPDASDVNNRVFMNEHVDPLVYWGCSSRTTPLRNAELHNTLEHTRLDDWQLDLVHPGDWQMSEFTANDVHFRALSIAPVDLQTVEDALLRGGNEPIFLMAYHEPGAEKNYHPESFYYYYSKARQKLMLMLNLRPDLQLPGPEDVLKAEFRAYPYQYENDAALIVFSMIATDLDWDAQQPLFDTMIEYATTFNYYLHEDLQHTLMLGTWQTGVAFGYPDGWIEWLSDDGVVTVSLNGARGDDVPRIRVILLEEDATDSLYAAYNLTPVQMDVIEAGFALSCNPELPAFQYSRDGHRGYLVVDANYVLEISVPEADFNNYNALFVSIANSIVEATIEPWNDCG